MAKVTDWEIPREFGLGNELARWRVRGYSLVGPDAVKQDFELVVTAFSKNQAEMRFRYLFGDGIHQVTDIAKIEDAPSSRLADGAAGRERAKLTAGD